MDVRNFASLSNQTRKMTDCSVVVPRHNAMQSASITVWLIDALSVASMLGVGATVLRVWKGRAADSWRRAVYAGRNLGPQTIGLLGREGGFVPSQAASAIDAVPSKLGAAQRGTATRPLPSDFEVSAFLIEAKSLFLRLQIAWDGSRVDDVRSLSTPAMADAIVAQLEARDSQALTTDVIELRAEVLDVRDDAGSRYVNVRFSGSLRDDALGEVRAFDEVWGLTAREGSTAWKLATVQRVESLPV